MLTLARTALKNAGITLAPAAGALSMLQAQAVRGLSGTSGSSDKPVEPTYTYASPGSSLREPGLGIGHSLGNPTYEYDPKPKGHFSLSDPFPSPNGQTSARSKQDAKVQAAVKAAEAEAAKQNKKNSVVEPTYTYASPGSSVSSPSYGLSVKDPVYFTDPKPQEAGAKDGKGKSKGEKKKGERKGLRPDDYAQAPYTVSQSGSMRDPKYVSMSDPQDK